MLPRSNLLWVVVDYPLHPSAHRDLDFFFSASMRNLHRINNYTPMRRAVAEISYNLVSIFVFVERVGT